MNINVSKEQFDLIISALHYTTKMSQMFLGNESLYGMEMPKLIGELLDQKEKLEAPVDKTHVVIRVFGGMVESAYANCEVVVEVYDFDDLLQHGAEAMKEEYEEIANNPKYHSVY